MSTFSDTLQQLLKKRGMTQSELARKTGITVSAISNYVRDGVDPSLSKALLIADALDVPIDVLAGRKPAVSYYSINLTGLSDDGMQAVEDFAEFTRQREVAERARLNRGQKGEIA